MVAALLSSMMTICRGWRSIHQQLRLFDILEVYVFIDATLNFILVALSVLEKRSLRNVELAVFIKEVLGCSRLPILATWKQERNIVIFNIMKERKYSFEALRPFFLFSKLLRFHKMSLFVADCASTRSSRKFSTDSGPRLLENILYLFQSIESWHFLVARSSSSLSNLRCSCCTLR